MWISLILTATAATGAEDGAMLKFERQRIGETTFEGAAVFDVDQDGVLDIVSGGYWYKGPDFAEARKICDVMPVDDYFDDFSSYPMDVNGDGYPDVVTGAWWGETLRWYENPGAQGGDWRVHDIAKIGNIERPAFYDIDGDGRAEIIPNAPGAPVQIFKLDTDANGKGRGTFTQHVLTEGPSGHGIGFGDINGDGRSDIVLSNGWLEAPEDPYGGAWVMHEEFNLGWSASVPILVHDVNGDGLADIIVGMGHDYGLHWWEQGRDAQGNRTWTKHDIDPNRSQYHDLQLADIDRDGELELVTGKRWRAHQGNDPGASDPVGLYYFNINGGDFERVTIDYGAPGEASGAGIYFWLADVTGNGWLDVVAPGKEGLFLFKNMGKA